MQPEEMMDFLVVWLKENEPRMLDTLETIVNIDSFSHDYDGVANVREVLNERLTLSGIDTELVTLHGTHALRATVGHGGPQHIFLTGHMDTVFKAGTVAQRPFTITDGVAYGPGVSDMKAGLVMNTFILMALQALDQLTPLPLTISLFITGDEEIGSPNGRVLIQKYLKPATAVLNAEPGRISGNVVKARKGGATYTVEVQGVAAHAGMSHSDGVSAIETLARIIQSVHQLTNYKTGVTTNVGVISGGSTPNTVAASARAEIDVRFEKLEQVDDIELALQRCVDQHGVTGATATLTKLAGFLPFEEKASVQLLAIYCREAQAMGINVAGEFTGGCSDAGWTSAMGIPTLCATGPVGGYSHTERECCLVNTMVERAMMVIRTCMALSSMAPLSVES